MNNQIVKIIPSEVSELDPGQLVDRAFKIATHLARVVRAGEMFCTINGEEFVKVDGWIAMGQLLGLSPHVTDVRSIIDGGFEAFVEIRSRTGVVHATASAICGMDEKKWAAAPAFSRRSMAVTRAIGKAYRISFSWVMRLAGMSATPAEDMPQFTPEKREDEPPPPSDADRRANGEVYDPMAHRWVKKPVKSAQPGQWDGHWPK